MPRLKIFFSFLLLAIFSFGFSEAFAQCTGFTSVITTPSCPYIGPTGQYQVFSATLCIVQNNLTGGLATMWTSITNALAPVLQMLLIIYVALYGYAFMVGMAGAEPKEFLFRMIKLAVIYVLIGTSNQCYFFQYVYGFFMAAMQQMANFAGASGGSLFTSSNIGGSVASNVAGGVVANTGFSGLDNFIMTQTTMLVIVGAVAVAFLLSGPGMIVSFLISIGMYEMLKGLFMLFKTMAFALISLTLCLMFAPIFLCLMLFETTRGMFDEWLHLVVSYTLQPALIFFYLVLMAPLVNMPVFIFNTLQTGSIIVPHTWNINLLLTNFTVNGWDFNGGPGSGCASCNPVIPPDPTCTMCTTQPLIGPVGLSTLINFTSNGTSTGTVVATLPLFAAMMLYIIQWIIVSFATVAFMKKVPDLATRLSMMGSPLNTPNLGAAGAGTSSSGQGLGPSLIIPGFTSGYGGDSVRRHIKRPLTRALEKVRVVPRLLGKDMESLAAGDRVRDFKSAIKSDGGVTRSNIGEMEDIINLAVSNKKITEEQLDELEGMIEKTGSKRLMAVYKTAMKEKEAAKKKGATEEDN